MIDVTDLVKLQNARTPDDVRRIMRDPTMTHGRCRALAAIGRCTVTHNVIDSDLILCMIDAMDDVPWKCMESLVEMADIKIWPKIPKLKKTRAVRKSVRKVRLKKI